MLRRHFTNVLLGSGFAATAASIIYPVLQFIIPPENAGSAVMSVSALIAYSVNARGDEIVVSRV